MLVLCSTQQEVLLLSQKALTLFYVWEKKGMQQEEPIDKKQFGCMEQAVLMFPLWVTWKPVWSGMEQFQVQVYSVGFQLQFINPEVFRLPFQMISLCH